MSLSSLSGKAIFFSWPSGRNVENVDASVLKVIAYTDTDTNAVCSYTLYDDDGYGKDYNDPSHLSVIHIEADGTVSCEGSEERTITPCFICS